MKQRTFNVVVVAVVAAAAVAATRWPRLNDVETGRTPEYPELRDREFAASEAAVLRAATHAVEALPGWTFVGAGQGKGGTQLQALATGTLRQESDVNVAIHRQGGKTVVRVRSRSRFGPWDFGEGARNIEAFFAELDRQMARPPAEPPRPPRKPDPR
jgi:uncharacterized protein (DUF1499 family)